MLFRPGGDLLSHALRRSTIGAEGFHGRVRNGIGCIAPRYGHQTKAKTVHVLARYVYYLWEHFIELLASVHLFYIARILTVVVAGDRFSSVLPLELSVKPIERLVPVSFTHYCASTPGLSTWWSSTALRRDLVLREASRLDAFSGYPFRT